MFGSLKLAKRMGFTRNEEVGSVWLFPIFKFKYPNLEYPERVALSVCNTTWDESDPA